MKKSMVILGLSTWTIAGCSQDFEKEVLEDPQNVVTQQFESVPQLEPNKKSPDFGITALEASIDQGSGELVIRYHATENVVVGLCAQTTDGHETCVVEAEDVSQVLSLDDVASSHYRVTMMDPQGNQRDYGPYAMPTGEQWQDVIACESEIQLEDVRLEQRGKRLYVESDEELRVQVCDDGVCDETRGIDGFEVDYYGESTRVTLQDQYGCKVEILKKPIID